jgi:hypothetical protein
MRRFTKKPSVPGHQIAGPYHAEARRRIVPSDPRAHRTPSKASPASIEQITPPAIAIAVCSTRRFRMFVNSPPALEVSRRKSVPIEGLSSFLRVTPQGASLPKVIGRLVIRLQKDCQEIGPFNRFADSGFPAGGLGFQITWIPSMPLQLPLCGLPSEARCLPRRCRPATHCPRLAPSHLRKSLWLRRRERCRNFP